MPAHGFQDLPLGIHASPYPLSTDRRQHARLARRASSASNPFARSICVLCWQPSASCSKVCPTLLGMFSGPCVSAPASALCLRFTRARYPPAWPAVIRDTCPLPDESLGAPSSRPQDLGALGAILVLPQRPTSSATDEITGLKDKRCCGFVVCSMSANRTANHVRRVTMLGLGTRNVQTSLIIPPH